MVLQFGFAWIPFLPISQSNAVTIFYALGIIATIFAFISLVKKEAAAAIGIILFEIGVAYVVGMGGGLGK